MEKSKASELKMQMLSHHMQQIQQQLEGLEEALQEMQSSIDGLADLKAREEGAEILVPIVSGIFAKAKLLAPDRFIVNVGANVAVPKTSDEVRALLEAQQETLRKTQQDMIAQLQEFMAQAQEIEAHLQGDA